MELLLDGGDLCATIERDLQGEVKADGTFETADAAAYRRQTAARMKAAAVAGLFGG
jgi:hypothetical protein